jgi:hypothetical protein
MAAAKKEEQGGPAAKAFSLVAARVAVAIDEEGGP